MIVERAGPLLSCMHTVAIIGTGAVKQLINTTIRARAPTASRQQLNAGAARLSTPTRSACRPLSACRRQPGRLPRTHCLQGQHTQQQHEPSRTCPPPLPPPPPCLSTFVPVTHVSPRRCALPSTITSPVTHKEPCSVTSPATNTLPAACTACGWFDVRRAACGPAGTHAAARQPALVKQHRHQQSRMCAAAAQPHAPVMHVSPPEIDALPSTATSLVRQMACLTLTSVCATLW